MLGVVCIKLTVFKSHLYGIEIPMMSVLLIMSLMFKSHLYGIEISHQQWSESEGR